MRFFTIFGILPIFRQSVNIFLTLALSTFLVSPAFADAKSYFRISVVDEATNRGVPLVELTTTDARKFWTDSGGEIALNWPEMTGKRVWFGVKSHGYEYPADGFGYRGVALKIQPGARAIIKIKRVNIAERLYRLTGAGIYLDSVRLGLTVPVKNPNLNGDVFGQDTVEVTPYRGKLYWFWGDTSRPSYPLGQFATSGATSPLPGLSPERGVDYTYWTDAEGFSKKMIPLPDASGPIWIGGLFTLADKLWTHYTKLDGSGKPAEQGLARFDDASAVFVPVQKFPLDAPLVPDGHPFQAVVKSQNYLYFSPETGDAMPLVRVPADPISILDPRKYEGFTCLKPGSRYQKDGTTLERDASGKLVYGWKANTETLGFTEENELEKSGKLRADERILNLRDIVTDAKIQTHGGSVYWNSYRKRWIMIAGQSFGTPSFLGEIWFAEADTPVGPWVYARKIVTHDNYTFYNPTQHPFFDLDNGKRIFFEGTYTATYTQNPEKTPGYDYNQIMYGLTLSDPRLSLPAPVYKVGGPPFYAMREVLDVRKLWPKVRRAEFFAVPPANRAPGQIPIYADGVMLALQPVKPSDAPLFYALPLTPAADEKPSPAVIPFPADAPICRVWRSPSVTLALDFDAVFGSVIRGRGMALTRPFGPPSPNSGRGGRGVRAIFSIIPQP